VRGRHPAAAAVTCALHRRLALDWRGKSHRL